MFSAPGRFTGFFGDFEMLKSILGALALAGAMVLPFSGYEAHNYLAEAEEMGCITDIECVKLCKKLGGGDECLDF